MASIFCAVFGNLEGAIEARADTGERGDFIRSQQSNTRRDFLRGLPAFQKLL